MYYPPFLQPVFDDADIKHTGMDLWITNCGPRIQGEVRTTSTLHIMITSRKIFPDYQQRSISRDTWSRRYQFTWLSRKQALSPMMTTRISSNNLVIAYGVYNINPSYTNWFVWVAACALLINQLTCVYTRYTSVYAQLLEDSLLEHMTHAHFYHSHSFTQLTRSLISWWVSSQPWLDCTLAPCSH